MRVIGRLQLEAYIQNHADLRTQVDAWLCEVSEAVWKDTKPIKARYLSASFLSDNRVVFNLKGNRYRLLVKINYDLQIITIQKIGTHADYSKWNL